MPPLRGHSMSVAVRDEAVEQERAAAGPCAGTGRGRCRPGCGRPRRRRPRARPRRRRRGSRGRRRWPGRTCRSCAGGRGRPRSRRAGRWRGRPRGPPTRTRAASPRDEGLAGPASLGVADVVLAEGGEAGTAGEGIGDHALSPSPPPTTRSRGGRPRTSSMSRRASRPARRAGRPGPTARGRARGRTGGPRRRCRGRPGGAGS